MAEGGAESDSEIIDDIREEFKKKMSKYYSKQTCTGPWTIKWVNNFKKMIKEAHQLPVGKHHIYKQLVQDKYNSFEGHKRLKHLMRRIRHNGRDLSIPAVPWEKAFDIIWEYHLKCKHGSLIETMNLIKSRYYIDINCAYQVIQLCHKCKHKNSLISVVEEPIFNKKATMEILNLSYTPDGHYNYLLIYTDVSTGLVQLRALTKVVYLELVLKLMNIFTDLGPPQVLTIYDPYEFDGVIEALNQMFKPSVITLDLSIPRNSKGTSVKEMLFKWMASEDSIHWEIGCFTIQWEINNEITAGKTPQQIVFGLDNSGQPPTTQNEHSKNGQSCELDMPSLPPESPDTEIKLFEEPATHMSDLKPTAPNEDVVYINTLDDSFVKVEENFTDSDNVESSNIFKGKQIKSYNSASIKKKVYANKKVLVSGQNDMTNIQGEADSCNTPIKLKVDEETAVVYDSSSHNIDANVPTPIKMEYPEAPIKLENSNYSIMCSVCDKEVLHQSYTCMQCMSVIHLKCGNIENGIPAEDKIICLLCEKVMKKKKT